MEQKEVKIIGLKTNTQMGILQSCELKFDKENNLIIVKGEVGSGKTTLQKSLQLGTLGSDTLKSDKKLYGKIDQEIQLLDGEDSVFIGCKSDKEGSLNYVIYTRDSDGKKNTQPIIDGVKCTPADYLKNLQTALTWRMEELTSESLTVQKKILLELYKSELADLGIIFDKKDTKYSQSILGMIDMAVDERSRLHFERTRIGGFANHLEELGVDVNEPATYPERFDVSALEKSKNELQFKIENVSSVKKNDLEKIKNDAKSINLELKEHNSLIKSRNSDKESRYEVKKEQYSQNTHTLQGIKTDLKTLNEEGCLSAESYKMFLSMLDDNFKNEGAMCEKLEEELKFDENQNCTSESHSNVIIQGLISELSNLRNKYIELEEKPQDTSDFEKDLEDVLNKLILAKKQNEKCDMVDAYNAWKFANEKVVELRNKYAAMLSSVNTGVDGLNISVDKNADKLDIYLTYNGAYDKKYFNNSNLEDRKLSSYSGTQKPLICLLLQNYLLSKKPKAMRYLWIDNVPVDNKTKELLNKMGDDLGVTIIVNITGDFSKDGLESGEILLDGGEVFFN